MKRFELKNIETILANNKKIKQKYYQETGSIPIIDQGKEMIGGYTDNSKYLIKLELPVTIFGDHTRAVKYIDFDFAIGADGVHIIKTPPEFIPKMFYYYLKSLEIPSRGYARHFQYLKNKNIPCPSKENQERISKILDKSHRLIEIRTKIDNLIFNLINSYFLKIFGDPQLNPLGWEKKPLNYFAKIDKRSIKPEEIRNGIKYIGLENIEKNSGKILSIIITQSNEIKSSKFQFSKNHVLYGKLRSYLNKVALPDFDGICSTDIIPIIPIKGKSKRYFVAYLLKTKYFQKFAITKSKGDYPRIGIPDIENFLVPLPSIELQEHFENIVTKIMNMTKFNSQEKISELVHSLLLKTNLNKL